MLRRLVRLASLAHLATLLNSLLVADLGPSSLTTVNLPASLVLPHALGSHDLDGAILGGQRIRSDDGLGALDRVARDAAQVLGGGLLDRLALGHVDDVLLGDGGVGVVLEDAQLGGARLGGDVPQVAADAELAAPEALPPLDQVPPRPGRLDAQLGQLARCEGEERLPRGELGGVRAQAPADELEERRGVGAEGRRLRDHGRVPARRRG